MHERFQPRAAADLLFDSLRLYRENAAAFLLVAALPSFVGELLLDRAIESGWFGGVLLGGVALVIEALSTAAVTVLTCRLATGERPSLSSLPRLTSRAPLASVVLTFIAAALVVMGGLLLLVVPGLVFSAWLLLAPTVAVVEGSGVDASFRRSRALGRGFYARNFALAFAAFWLPAILLNILLAAFSAEDGLQSNIAYNAFTALLAPLEAILTVLIYFDMRVRKEGLDAARFAEELDANTGAA